MFNMSYCKYRNTLEALKELNFNDIDDVESRREHQARIDLVDEMVEILTNLGYNIEEPEEEIELMNQYVDYDAN